MVRDAARMGLGITILPKFLVNEDLRAGKLVPLLEDFPVNGYWIKLQVPRMKMNRPTVRELITHLKSCMQPAPPWRGDIEPFLRARLIYWKKSSRGAGCSSSSPRRWSVS